MRAKQSRTERLIAIMLVHALVAFLLVPLHYLVEFVVADLYEPEFLLLLLFLLVTGGTSGVALAQLWLVAMWAALDTMHWAIRFAVATIALALLLGLWSAIHVIHRSRNDGNIVNSDYSAFVDLGVVRATLLATSYVSLVALSGWITRLVWPVAFTVRTDHRPSAHARWQIGIRDVLLATLLIGIILALGKWQQEFWIDEASSMFQYDEMPLILLAVHTLVATPLVGLLAYRTLTRDPAAKAARGRLPLYLIVCGIETAILLTTFAVLGWNPSDSTVVVGATAIYSLTITGTQLLVVAATLRALRAAGGGIVRASDAGC